MKRPSGGRGEFELAEQFGSVGPRDLIDHDLRVDFTPLSIKSVGVRVRLLDGKLRLRLTDKSYMHLHRQVIAALLLPKSIRDETRLAGGRPTIMVERYVLRRMMIGGLTLRASSATIKFDKLEVMNASQVADELDFAKRLARIVRIYKSARKFPEEVRPLIVQHEGMMRTAAVLPKSAEGLVDDLMVWFADNAFEFGAQYTFGTDVLPVLEEIAGVSAQTREQPIDIDDIAPEEVEVRRREVERWRQWARRRGSESAKFSKGRQTCL